jgi:hypothetical protein
MSYLPIKVSNVAETSKPLRTIYSHIYTVLYVHAQMVFIQMVFNDEDCYVEDKKY